MFRVNSVIFHVTLGTYIAENERRNLRDEPPLSRVLKFMNCFNFTKKKSPRVWPLLLCVSSKVIKCFSLFAALNLLQQVYERKFLFLLYCIS